MTIALHAGTIGHVPVLVGMPARVPAPAVVWLHGFGADALANAAELERLAAEQQPDGGWPVDFASYSPAAALEWRGYMTVRAISILQRNHRL